MRDREKERDRQAKADRNSQTKKEVKVKYSITSLRDGLPVKISLRRRNEPWDLSGPQGTVVY